MKPSFIVIEVEDAETQAAKTQKVGFEYRE